MMTGLKFIPLAEVTAVVFATPLIVAVYSTVIQKEPMGRGMFIAILLGFLGVLVVVRPTPYHFHFAHLVMLLFAVSSAYLSITARALIKTESPLTLNLYIYPATIILGGYFAWRDWVTPDLLSLAALFGVALFASIALLSITKAVHCASPARVAPFDYSRMIWTVSIGLIFWGELPDAITWIGISVIIFCGIYILRHSRNIQKNT
jgi:drug/metabolite transporter (DMT)-like permease